MTDQFSRFKESWSMHCYQNGTFELFFIIIVIIIIIIIIIIVIIIIIKNNIIIIIFPSFSKLFFPLVFVQTMYFYSFPGNNIYVPGDCNILLICVCDL